MVELHTETTVLRPLDRTRPDELAAVLEVYRQCEDFLALGPVATASAEMVQADLDLSVEQGGVFYGIYDRVTGQMTGILDFVLAGYEGNEQLADLSLLMIGSPYRSRGLGEAVVRAVEAAIRRDGRARAIKSGVQVNNPSGIRFWQRMGYQIVSGPELMADGTTVYGLIKMLS